MGALDGNDVGVVILAGKIQNIFIGELQNTVFLAESKIAVYKFLYQALHAAENFSGAALPDNSSLRQDSPQKHICESL